MVHGKVLKYNIGFTSVEVQYTGIACDKGNLVSANTCDYYFFCF